MYTLYRIPKDYMTIILKMAKQDGIDDFWHYPGIIIHGLDMVFPFKLDSKFMSKNGKKDGLIEVHSHSECSECKHIFYPGDTVLFEEYEEGDNIYCPYCASRKLKDEISDMVDMLNNISYG